MKSKEEVEKRLRKLRLRYARKYVEASQQRLHANCVHNREHMPSSVPTSPVRPQPRDGLTVPSRHVSLVVLQEAQPVSLCMYGSEDPASWPGDVCDRDEIARSCKLFKPSTDLGQAKEDFLELMADDEYVFNNYRDVATLQWVLGERVHGVPLTWLERLGFWLRSKLSRVRPPAPQLPASLPDDLWSETPKNDPHQDP